MMWRALACPLREAKKCLGDQAVLNFLPTGAINPNRFAYAWRGNAENKRSMYKGKAFELEMHTLC
jgi:hypothetical protein